MESINVTFDEGYGKKTKQDLVEQEIEELEQEVKVKEDKPLEEEPTDDHGQKMESIRGRRKTYYLIIHH